VTPLLEGTGLKKVFPVGRGQSLHALDGVDLAVARGEVIVIIGPSGSGKSTLIGCLNGLEQADAGEIRIDGRTVKAHSHRMWREVLQRIGPLESDLGLGLFDTDVLSMKARVAGFTLAVCCDVFVHHFGTRTFAHGSANPPPPVPDRRNSTTAN